ncbi:hypothetical protein BTVI_44355 [Pitangus sulphuratus]|nr:hypothetical protein BTVI_44355 [Pitangus sulphuratus]
MLLACLLTGAHAGSFSAAVDLQPQVIFCWAAFQSLFLQTVALHGVVVARVQDPSAFGLVEPCATGLDPSIQPVQIPLPILQQIYIPNQLGVVHKFTEGTLDPFIQIINKDVRQDWGQYGFPNTLGNIPSDRLPTGCSTVHQDSPDLTIQSVPKLVNSAPVQKGLKMKLSQAKDGYGGLEFRSDIRVLNYASYFLVSGHWRGDKASITALGTENNYPVKPSDFPIINCTYPSFSTMLIVKYPLGSRGYSWATHTYQAIWLQLIAKSGLDYFHDEYLCAPRQGGKTNVVLLTMGGLLQNCSGEEYGLLGQQRIKK